jgi:hypothetical protein
LRSRNDYDGTITEKTEVLSGRSSELFVFFGLARPFKFSNSRRFCSPAK